MPESSGGLSGLAEDLHLYINEFSDMFVCHRKDNTDKAHHYICGLVQSDRRNMERMEEAVSDADYEALQQFISNSPWDRRAVMNRVAAESDKLLGGTGRTGLLIDESAFAKKGKASVGVARQWNGRLGKVENSRVAVYGALCAGIRVIPVDAEFFLPEIRTDDTVRCRRSGVPEARSDHRTKPEPALETVRRQRKLGVRFDYVSADGLYGNSMPFCQSLDDDGEVFICHIHSDKHVYPEDPDPQIPQRRSSRGRKPSKLKAMTGSIRVDKLFEKIKNDGCGRIKVRDTTTGVSEADIYRLPVWIWDGEEETARRWTLIIRRDVLSPTDIKYCLTNTSDTVPTSVIAEMEAQRFWIERSFEDAKSQAGMAEYQVRGWKAWHHHMALVMMTMLFMTKQRMIYNDEHPLLSCYDIKVLPAYFLPSRKNSEDEILRRMKVRHSKRRAASESAARKRKVLLEIAGET